AFYREEFHMLLSVVITVVAVAVLLLAEAWGPAWLIWVAKPIASSGFVAAALQAGALGDGYGKAILAALALSWLGDVLLIPKTPQFFLAGLGAFLCGHLAFGAAFLMRGVSVPWAAAALLGLVPAAWAVGRWLLPNVPDAMLLPVLCYMAVIT